MLQDIEKKVSSEVRNNQKSKVFILFVVYLKKKKKKEPILTKRMQSCFCTRVWCRFSGVLLWAGPGDTTFSSKSTTISPFTVMLAKEEL